MLSNATQPLTAEEIALIQESFARVEPVADLAAALFYGRLFELDPATKPLFRGDMQGQGRKLMAMLATVIAGLSRLPALLPAIRALGQRHRGYGVTDEHYASVGAALLWTLEQGLGEHWTPQVCAAWQRAYALLSAVMTAVDGAPEPRPRHVPLTSSQ